MQISTEIISRIKAQLGGNDAEFFARVWSDGDVQKYAERLKNIGFCNDQMVLDAGFGMGQWMYCLSQLNHHVEGIEYSQVRCDSVRTIFDMLDVTNVNLKQGSIEELPYSDNQFDSIFCYGVIFITDFKRSLREFHRVLKPGGKLYVTGNGLGWYLHLLLDQRNQSDSYDPRQLAINALTKSLAQTYELGESSPGQVVIPSKVMVSAAEQIGFQLVSNSPEGMTNGEASFYDATEYLGEEFIYELRLNKSA